MDTPIHAVQATSALSSSLYFWWLAYLRCSKDYWWCCQQKGNCEDERLVNVYEQFGDVFKYRTLLDWWSDYGAHLFDSPQVEMDFVKYFPSGVEVLISQDLIKPRAGMLCLAIPLGLDHQKAIASTLEVWDVATIRGQHYMQDAQYQLHPIEFKSKQTIVPSYRTWVMLQCVATSKSTDRFNAWSGYQIGHHLQLSPKNTMQANDSRAVTLRKQSNIRAHFSRKIKDANSLIENVEIGRFPCKDPVAKVQRWTVRQIKDLEHAISEGQWQNSNWLMQEHAFMLPGHELNLGLTSDTRKCDVMDVLKDFGSLNMPFLKPKRIRIKKASSTRSVNLSIWDETILAMPVRSKNG